MPYNATVTLWRDKITGKGYKYNIVIDGNETLHELAMIISLAVHKKEKKTKFTGKPRSYEYIHGALKNSSCRNFIIPEDCKNIAFRLNAQDTQNNEHNLLEAANELNAQTTFEKKVDGKGNIYYSKPEYRLGYTQAHTLIIDIDSKDLDNLTNVCLFYEEVLNCKFNIIETGNGYWLFSNKKYQDKETWIYDHCRVLSPDLQRRYFDEYRQDLINLDTVKAGTFRPATPETVRASKLYQAPKHLKFDIAFTFLSIKRERSTIRYTRKHKDDKITLIRSTEE